MSVCSFITIIPAVPRPRHPPRKRTSSKSSLMSSWSGPSTPIEMPPQIVPLCLPPFMPPASLDRKSTRLNSSHQIISYAVFCLKKKKKKQHAASHHNNQHSQLLR